MRGDLNKNSVGQNYGDRKRNGLLDLHNLNIASAPQPPAAKVGPKTQTIGASDAYKKDGNASKVGGCGQDKYLGTRQLYSKDAPYKLAKFNLLSTGQRGMFIDDKQSDDFLKTVINTPYLETSAKYRKAVSTHNSQQKPVQKPTGSTGKPAAPKTVQSSAHSSVPPSNIAARIAKATRGAPVTPNPITRSDVAARPPIPAGTNPQTRKTP